MNRSVSIMLLFILMQLSAVSAQTLSLDSCHAMAIRNYPLIKQYDLLNASAEYSVKNANKNYLPQFSINGIGGYIIKGLPTNPGAPEPDKFQLIGIGQVNQVIWDGGGTGSKKELINAQTATARAELDVDVHSLHERVNQLFFGIILLNDQLKNLDLMIANLRRNYEAVQLTEQNGFAFPSDVQEVEAEILTQTQKITETVYVRNGYVAMLSVIIGVEINEDAAFIAPSTAVISTAAIERPEINVFRSQQQQADVELKLSKVNFMPKVSLMGAGILMEPGMSLGGAKLTNLAIAGLSLSWSTSGLYGNKSMGEISRIKKESLQAKEEVFIYNTKVKQAQLLSEVEKQQALVKSDERIVSLRSEIRKSYELKYKNGLCTMNQLLTAIDNESQAMHSKSLHETQLNLNIVNYNTNISR